MNTAEDIIAHPERYREACRYKKLATLFFEPSTRTRLSFEAAMHELGGAVLSVTDAAASSASKGESVADTAKTVSCYADIIAMRHPKEGAALVAASSASIPVINAGDGGHCHPTQTLADLLTIRREKGRLGNLTVGLCGDLKFGRTVHSLISALSRYEGLRFVLISPEELKVPSYVKNDALKSRSIPYLQTTDLEFEGHMLMAPAGYDRVLREIYGDYMQLPPEEQRVPSHSDDIEIYKDGRPQEPIVRS